MATTRPARAATTTIGKNIRRRLSSGRWGKLQRPALALSLVILFSSIGWYVGASLRTDVYTEGFQILRAKGVKDAQTYWEKHSERGELGAFVGLGYLYLEDNPDDADRLLTCAAAEGDQLIRAQALYFLGHLRQSGPCDEVVAAYAESMYLFEKLDMPFYCFQSRVMLAWSYHACDRNEDARAVFLKAAANRPEKAKTGRLWSLGARIEWRNGNASGAITFGERALAETVEVRMRNHILTALAYYHILSGTLERGEELNNQAKDGLYIRLNKYALARCRGEDVSPWLPEIQKEIESGNDHLRELFEEINRVCD